MRIVYDDQTQLQINMYKKDLIHNSVLDHSKIPYCHMHTIYRVQSSSIMNWLNQRQNLFIMGTFFQFQFGNGFWYDFPIIYRNLFRQMFLLLHIPSCILNLISILKMRGVCKSVYTISTYMCQCDIYLSMHFPEKATERKGAFIALHANANFSLIVFLALDSL